MDQGNVDIWTLVGSLLPIKDLPSFFRLSKLHNKVSERDDFWKSICRSHYGEWDRDELNRVKLDELEYDTGLSWRDIVSSFTKRRKEVKETIRDPCTSRVLKDILEQHFDQFYVRSPTRTTFYYDSFLNEVRNGDVGICVAPNHVSLFMVDGLLSSIPPAETCWPNKSIDYSQVGSNVFISMTENDFLSSSFKSCYESHNLAEFYDPRRPEDVFLFKHEDIQLIFSATRKKGETPVRFVCSAVGQYLGKVILHIWSHSK